MSHKDGFVFYRSFYEAGSCLNDSQFRELINAICQYALDSKEPDLNGVVSGMFQLIKPQIDANNKRYENGLKGGRPKKPNDNQTETKQKPNHNQTITKQKPNNNQSETKPKPKEKDKVKDKVKDKDNDKDNVKEKEYTPEGAIMIHDEKYNEVEHDLTFLRMVQEAKRKAGVL